MLVLSWFNVINYVLCSSVIYVWDILCLGCKPKLCVFQNTQGFLLQVFCVFLQVLFVHIVVWILFVCFRFGFILFVGELCFDFGGEPPPLRVIYVIWFLCTRGQ